jgi:hypothetical protein
MGRAFFESASDREEALSGQEKLKQYCQALLSTAEFRNLD